MSGSLASFSVWMPVPCRYRAPLCTSTKPVLLKSLEIDVAPVPVVLLKVPALLKVPLPIMSASVEALKVAPAWLMKRPSRSMRPSVQLAV